MRMSNEEMITQVWKAIYGNGKDGLNVRMTRVEANQTLQMKYDDEFRAWIRKRLFIVIVLAVVAGGSPLARGLLEWFGIKGQPVAEAVAKEFPRVGAE